MSVSLTRNSTKEHLEREVISLDGWWEIAESILPDEAPKAYLRRVQVPGLVHSSVPAFENVDLFDGNGYAKFFAPPNPHFAQLFKGMKVPERILPAHSKQTPAGISYQERDYFWYRTTFRAPARRQVAILKVGKAQYGSQVWVNGRESGRHLSNFTSASYEISSLVLWSEDNEVLIRVGAHPGVLPRSTSHGIDFEIPSWPPGIWDSVSVAFCDNPHIETIQVAPRIATSQVLVQTKLKNYTDRPISCELEHRVHERTGTQSLSRRNQMVQLAAGEIKIVVETIDLPSARLWTPETPHLYVIETSTTGDSVSARFGMREFRFDTPTRRAYLNGQPYFMRGSTAALTRFFDDPRSGQLPWTDEWVRRLLITIPKSMHWNMVRAFVGAWPEKWLEIADEAGLLVEYGFPMTYQPQTPPDAEALITEYTAWMRDAWNHPSVVIWEAWNEGTPPIVSEKVVPAVRTLDLSHRPWSCGFNAPAGPDDPVDNHPYRFMGNTLTESGRRQYRLDGEFDMSALESGTGCEQFPSTPLTGHAMTITEYEWLWLNRDGSPTLLTQELYRTLPYPVETAEQRFETNAYLIAGLTEYWRAHRHYAGVIHFAYLLASHPWVTTSDHFVDIEALRLHPCFESYVSEAFKPLGLYINFWQRTLPAGEKRPIVVMMVNDESREMQGTLTLALEDSSGALMSQQSLPFAVASLGQETYRFDFEAPARVGRFVMKAVAAAASSSNGPTVSRRHLEILPRSVSAAEENVTPKIGGFLHS